MNVTIFLIPQERLSNLRRALHYGAMTRGWRIAAGLALVVQGVLLFEAGLADADKWASVIGAFATLLGLGVPGYGVVLSRRALRSGPYTVCDGIRTRWIATQTIAGIVAAGSMVAGGLAKKGKNSVGTAPEADPVSADELAQVLVPAFGEQSITAQTISGPPEWREPAVGRIFHSSTCSMTSSWRAVATTLA